MALLSRPKTLELGSASLFWTLRNPNISPPKRPYDLPPSQSSPTKPSYQNQAMTSCSASSPSYDNHPLPRIVPISSDASTGIEGIEDITETQWAEESEESDGDMDDRGDREAVELEREGAKIQAVQQRNLDKARAADQRKSKLAELKARRAKRVVLSESPAKDPIDLSSSPPDPSSSTTTNETQAPQPITPIAGGSTPISWSPSPPNKRDQPVILRSSRKRKAHAIVLSETECEEDVPLALIKRDKGKGRAVPPERQAVAEVDGSEYDEGTEYDPGVEAFEEEQGEDEYDKAFDDFADVDIDFDSLSTTIASKSKSPIPSHHPITNVNRPASLTNGGPSRIRSPLVPIRINHNSDLVDDLDCEPGLPMISDLGKNEQEFYLNHWRRGADKAEAVRLEIEEGIREPPKKVMRPKAPKRGGFAFRGRGRGRGRGKGRKR